MNASRFQIVVIAFCTLVAGRSFAQTTAESKAAAESLFREGKRLLTEKNYEEACAAFEKSQKLDPAAGTLMNLGDCYEKSGKTASAWVTFTEAASAAKKKDQRERERVAKKRAAALEPTLARLTIEVGPDSGVEEVKRDGVIVPNDVWGTTLPVDPGEHELEATGSGRMPWSGTVTVDAGKSETFAIPSLERRLIAPATSSAKDRRDEDEGEQSDGSTQRTIGIIVGGAGALAIGVGSVLALSAKSDYDDAPGCSGNICQQAGFDQRNSAIDQAGTATIVFGVGTAGLIAGAILWMLAPSGPEDVAIEPAIGPSGARLSVGRSW
jgi:hypothetical protein